MHRKNKTTFDEGAPYENLLADSSEEEMLPKGAVRKAPQKKNRLQMNKIRRNKILHDTGDGSYNSQQQLH